MCLEDSLAGIECEEKEDDEDGTQDGQHYHSHHKVNSTVWIHFVVIFVIKDTGLVHKIAKSPIYGDVIHLLDL